MSKDFKLTSEYFGYQSKKDITNVDVRFLGRGSKNVLVNDKEKIVSSPGYSLVGAESSTGGINSSYDWVTSKNTELNIRVVSNGDAQFLYEGTWHKFHSFSADKKVRFAEWWSDTQKDDLLVMVNGAAELHVWSGGVAKLSGTTTNTITKQGAETWKEVKFLNGSPSFAKKVVINGNEYTYTGGEDTTTLTGVSPDPTGEATDSLITQWVGLNSPVPVSGFPIDFIGVNKNQLHLGSSTFRSVYISSATNYLDYTITSPRVPGGPALVTLDAPCQGFETQEDAMYITAGKDMWFQTVFQASSDNLNESLNIQKLKSGPRQAAISQEAIGKIKNSIVFISNEPTFDTLGRVENINTPQSKPLSDTIKPEFDEYNFTNCHIKYFKNQTFIAVPAEGLVLIYDHENQYWQPPQYISVSRLAVIDGKLHGHASSRDETYLLFDKNNYTHNGNPIESIAVIPYNSFGARALLKRFDEYYWEGYATLETKIDVAYRYEFGGFAGQIDGKNIDMSDKRIVFYTDSDGSLGRNPLGSNPIGSVTDSVNNLPKFRTKHSINKIGSFEMSVVFGTNTENYQWEVIAHGPNAMISTADSVSIKS